jgi:hypothetical protein
VDAEVLPDSGGAGPLAALAEMRMQCQLEHVGRSLAAHRRMEPPVRHASLVLVGAPSWTY